MTANERRILVTGAAGFIGSNFVHHMRRTHPDARIVALDALTYAGNLENLAAHEEGPFFRFIKADIRDAEALGKIFAEENFTEVVNFAAETHVDRSITAPEIFIDVNVRGTMVVLEAAKRHGTPRFLQIGTDEVYGSLGPEGRFTEESPIRPNSPYSASKAAADHLARAYWKTYGMDVLVTRCSNNYGPYQFPEKLIPLMLINCIEGRPLPVYGDGMNIRDWLHVADHCCAVDAVLLGGKTGEIYNIGGNNEWANIDIVRLIAEVVDDNLGRPKGESEKLITFVKDRPGHDRRYAIDSTRLRSELGWSPSYTFEEGMAETVNWYLTNPAWWKRIISGEYKDYYQKMYSNR